MTEREVELKSALSRLVRHAIDCEKRLDELCGLGNDAGQGYSMEICAAIDVLKKTEGEKQ